MNRTVVALVMLYLLSVCVMISQGIPGAHEPKYEGIYEPYIIVLDNYTIDGVRCTFSSGADNMPVCIIDNNASQDPTYDEMVNFIRWDKTDEMRYTDDFKCCEFATMVHNNAEKYGIRAHMVVITYQGNHSSHMINAFNTTDRGMIYVDCTGTDNGGYSCDAIDVTVENKGIKIVHRNDRVVDRYYVI